MKSKHISAIFSILLLAGLLYLGDPHKISETLGTIELKYIALVLVLYFINGLTKNLRWCVVLDDVGLFKKTLPLLFMGLSVNTVTPGRVGGEPFRAYLLNRNVNCSFGKGIASVFTEKVMDIIVLVCFSVVGVSFIVKELGSDNLISISLQLGIMVGLLVFILYAIFHPTLLERIARRVISISKKVSSHRYIDYFEKKLVSIIDSFKESLAEFTKKKKNAASGFLLTCIIWVNEATRLYLILIAMNIDVTLGAVIVASSVAAIVGGLLPGGAGNAAIITTILSTSGMEQSDATTAGFIMVITSIWVAIPLGMISSFLCKIDIHLDELIEKETTSVDGGCEETDVSEIAGDDIGKSPAPEHFDTKNTQENPLEKGRSSHKKIFK